MSELKYKQFGSLLSKIIDNRGKTCPTSESGVPLIATNCISNEHLYPLNSKVRYVDETTYSNWFRGHPEPDDMIFVTKGSPGRVAWVPNPVGFCIAQDMVAIRADNDEVDPKYLFAALRSKTIQQEIEGLHVGTLIPHFKKGDFNDLQIPIPSRKMQEYIGNQFFDISLKIDLLHRENKTLEAIAETLFRQWFVEEAQEDWKDGCLGDIADINPTYQLKKGEIAPYLEMRNVRTSTFNPEGWAKREFSSGMKFQNGDTLLARITPCLENGKTCFVMFLDDGEIGWGSTEYIVIRMRKPFHPFISYIIAKDKDFRDFAISSMSGSSGRQRAQANVIKEYDLKIPPLPAIEGLNRQFAEILPKLEKNSNQIRTIEKLRDTLLPELMSGEVRVAYAEN